MKLSPFFRYFGAKHKKIKYYPAPKWKRIIEPFAGSASYSLHFSDYEVLLYDGSEYVCGIWDYLIHASESDILALPHICLNVNHLQICQEAKWLISLCYAQNDSRPRTEISPSAIIGHDKTSPLAAWGKEFRQRIADQLQYIRHWKIAKCDYLQIPDIHGTHFIDPPYQTNKKRYPADVFDYPALANWCRQRNGQTIVCENSAANWLPFEHLYTQKHSNGKKTFSEAMYTQ